MAANTPNIFVYTVAYDDGFAPNPFHGICSLATCKPGIRKAAGLGDLVIGKAGVPDGHRAIFVMQVDEVLTYDQYWRAPRFASKKPRINGSLMMACGDNIYHRATPDGEWTQAHSYHSNRDGTGQPDNRTTSNTTREGPIESYYLAGSSTSGQTDRTFHHYATK